jgi:type VI secretion system protein ImpG
MKTLQELYVEELALLKDSARTFSDDNPALTSSLVRDNVDPDVDMILQGVSYLTAQIRREISTEFPAALQAMSQVLTPTLMQPLPSMTVLDFQPKAGLLKPLAIAAGMDADSVPVANDALGQPIHCRFSSEWDVTVLPLSVSQVQTSFVDLGAGEAAERGLEVKIELDSSKNDLANYEFSTLRLFLDLPVADSASWLALLKNQLRGLVVTDALGDTVMSRPEISLPGFSEPAADEDQGAGVDLHRLLKDYYTFVEKFLFFDIDLSDWQTRSGSRFTLTFSCAQPTSAMADLERRSVRLFATPASNAFDSYSVPSLLQEQQTEAELRARNRTLAGEESLEIISVKSVEAVQSGQTKGSSYQDLLRPTEVNSAAPGFTFYRKHGHQDGETIPCVGLKNSVMSSEADTVLRVRVSCCNGATANRVGAGDVTRHTDRTPELIGVTNLTQASEFHSAAIVSDRAWQVVSDQTLSLATVSTAEQLKRLLKHHIPAGLETTAKQKANIHKIEAIEHLEVQASEVFSNRRFVRGQTYTLTLNSEHFNGAGDLFLFAALLDQLFARQKVLNSYSQLVVRDSRSGTQTQWPVRLGGAG